MGQTRGMGTARISDSGMPGCGDAQPATPCHISPPRPRAVQSPPPPELHPMSRIHHVSEATFRTLLASGAIRPASLDDVLGTHHNRPLYRHPRTQAWFVQTLGAQQ